MEEFDLYEDGDAVLDIESAAQVEETEQTLHCSACGSAAPHHVKYVEDFGICVI